MRALAITLLLVGCGYDYENEAHDVGVVYVAGAAKQDVDESDLRPLTTVDGRGGFREGYPLLVQTSLQQCDLQWEASCRVVRRSFDLYIKSTFAWDGGCETDAPHFIYGLCASGQLERGTYRLHYGDEIETLEVPEHRWGLAIDTGLNR